MKVLSWVIEFVLVWAGFMIVVLAGGSFVFVIVANGGFINADFRELMTPLLKIGAIASLVGTVLYKVQKSCDKRNMSS